MGLTIVNAKNADGTPVDLTLFGIDPQGFLAPEPAEGQAVPDYAPGSSAETMTICMIQWFLYAIAVGLGAWLQTTPMPYAIEVGPVTTGVVLLFIFGMIGATIAVFRVTRTDPLSALGENR